MSVPSSRRGREEVRLGELPSGQTVERQFELFSNEVAQFEYEVSGSVDQERYFRVQKKGGLPSNIVRPVLNAFAERFDVIGIKEPFNGALAAIADVQPTMSLADAARVRQELGQLLPTIDEKATAVNELSREFYLRKGSPLGIHCGEIASFIKDLGSKLQAVDESDWWNQSGGYRRRGQRLEAASAVGTPSGGDDQEDPECVVCRTASSAYP